MTKSPNSPRFMRNIRMVLAYDGSNYLGWQWQPYGPTIQGSLQEAVKKLTGETADVIGSGRTDAGVHAIGQVANFLTSSNIPLNRMQPGLSHFLPKDIVIRRMEEVATTFHAQFQAKRKRYRYLLTDQPLELPFLRPYVWHIKRPLDADSMHQAGQCLVGRHDFRCFESKWPNKATSVRTIFELSVARYRGWPMWGGTPVATGSTLNSTMGTADGPFVVLEVVADGFLWNMVRAITGTLMNVGVGKWRAEDVERVLQMGDRRLAGETAPALGLYLVHVDYDDVATVE